MVQIDSSGQKFRSFQSGIGPFGEPQLLKLIAEQLNELLNYRSLVRTKRTPDLLVPGHWAVEAKITRPFGDNGREAENWSVNLLHPYPGNVSTIGDCFKLLQYPGPERCAVLVIGYEHDPPQIDLTRLVESFEAIVREVLRIRLSERIEERRSRLVHPVHQSLRVLAWEVMKDETAPLR
ncbi:MAG: hypothetical protein ACRD8A_04065 [Candidatus Acidiferrales bacterium]